MTAQTLPIDAVQFRGGRFCLDFVNTANWVDGQAVDERLVDADAVRTWAVRQGLGPIGTVAEDIARLQRLRLAIRRLVVNAVGSQVEDDLTTLNEARAHAAPLCRNGASLALDPSNGAGAIGRAVADSAVELLLATSRERIKMCDGDRCGWLFVDESPNNRRRWCSMADCGNRAKARRHYEATRKRRT